MFIECLYFIDIYQIHHQFLSAHLVSTHNLNINIACLPYVILKILDSYHILFYKNKNFIDHSDACLNVGYVAMWATSNLIKKKFNTILICFLLN